MRLWLPLCVLTISLACRGTEPAPAAPSSASASTAPATPGRESPLAPEINPPGDIPDTQTFIVYESKSGGYLLEVPEGWARTEHGADVTFTGKLDGVSVSVAPAASAPTAASARAGRARSIQMSGRAVQIEEIQESTLPNNPVVMIRYTSNSEPNPVTLKQVRQENETYLFFKGGREAALTLWAPLGADNVDQWQRMARSFSWR